MAQLSTSRTRKPFDDQVQRVQGSPVSLSTTQVLDQGKDHIVSFEGTSQFAAQGVSACGLAAFNFARVAFRIEQGGKNIPDVLDELSTKEVIEEIVAICAGWSSNLHLEAEDIHNLPLFNRCLHLESIEYGRPRPRHFRKILEKMKDIDNSTVMIITRPPEIIACIKFATRDPSKAPDLRSSITLDKPVFVIFDSHPRPSHPHGAGLSFSTSVENTAHTLSDILPTIDESMFDSDDFQWQAQLLANCSAHVYVAESLREDHEAAIIQSSLAILELRAKISELQRENQILGYDNQQLESDVGRLRASVRQEQAKMKLSVESTFAWAATALGNQVPVLGQSLGYISHAVAGPSGPSGASAGSGQKSEARHRSTDTSSTASAKHPPARPPIFSNTTGAQSIFADNPPPVPSEAPPAYDDLDSGSGEDMMDFDDLEIQTEEFARQLQNEYDSEDRRLRQEQQKLANEDHWNQTARQLQNEFDSETRRRRREKQGVPQEGYQNETANVPRKLQKEFDSEDGQFRREQQKFTQGRQTKNVARKLQNEFDSEDWRLHQEQQRLAHGRQTENVVRKLQNEFDSEDRRLHQEQQKLAQENRTANVARQLQNEFDSEDRRLRREHEELAHLVQATFQCNICLDELPQDDVAKVDECSHTTCRSCMMEFVSTKIQEHRYPIFCPMCTIVVNKPEQGQPSVISRLLIEQLGITEEQSQILTEMELAEFTIQIHCRQCKRPAFVDREDYTDVINIVCPQTDCHHVWCKKCEQTIVIDGLKHSCDGSSELDHLMKEKGWKHCPNCTTPILKETGCNHMACIATGCNTHFCYICGGMIVRSALNAEINQAVSAHFRTCQLFEVPD
ncbi:hypothetical protein JVU11DRAFT_5519 [Chiua virens]|nr:hypothetical protein JVU11DRAFT_5519 [Chiua virens]